MINRQITFKIGWRYKVDQEFRLAWHAMIEDGSVLTGRSLIQAENEQEAANLLVSKISHEYRIRPHLIRIESIIPMHKQPLQEDKETE
jgi:hypothetical protein